MIKKDFIHISKIDAAKRQLELSIRLFFINSDVVSIHTLTLASYNIMRDLCIAQNKSIFIKNKSLDFVKPEYHQKVKAALNKAENFFKHADKDPDEVLEFNPGITEFFIWDACAAYKSLTTEYPPLMMLFDMWFYAKNTDILLKEKIPIINAAMSKLNLDYNNRIQFLEMLPLISQIGLS
jgi:hypothetical protein